MVTCIHWRWHCDGLSHWGKVGFSIYLSSGPLTTIYGTFAVIPVVAPVDLPLLALGFGGAAIAATIPMLTECRFADHHKTGNNYTGIAACRH